MYNKSTKVLKVMSLAALQAFEQDADTTYLIFFDSNANSNFVE
jgi:hypothetical protein